MKKHKTGSEFALHLRQRPTERVVLEIPKDVLESVARVAGARDMSVKALIKRYIGQGLRDDASRLFADRVLQRAAEVLTNRVPPDEVDEILRELRAGPSE